jgi:hypothetical protein
MFYSSTHRDPTFETGVESKAPGANNEIAKECDEEDSIVVILPAIVHALDGQVGEKQVCQRVDKFSSIVASPLFSMRDSLT